MQKNKMKSKIEDPNQLAIRTVKENWFALEGLTTSQRNNKEIVMAAINESGIALEFASKKLRNDIEIVKAAVKENAWSLEYASKEIRANKDVVKIAVKEDGNTLRFASRELRDDVEIVKIAVKQNANALRSAGEISKSNFDIISLAIKNDSTILQALKKEYREDPKIVQLAVKQNGESLEFASTVLKRDKKIVIAAVKQNGYALKFASAILKNDIDVVTAAVSNYGVALEFASSKLKNDPEIINLAIKNDEKAIQYASIEYKKKYFNNIQNVKLKIECWNRGKEVYGLKYTKTKFESKKFLNKYKNDYFELTDESIESEIPFNENLGLKIALNNVEIHYRDGYRGGSIPASIKIIEIDTSETYRELLKATDKESCVVWFHDYVNTLTCNWNKIKNFDLTKITLYIQKRLDETDGTTYRILKGINYDNKEALEVDSYGEPKTGYFGPFVI
jgi:hypothetical protein